MGYTATLFHYWHYRQEDRNLISLMRLFHKKMSHYFYFQTQSFEYFAYYLFLKVPSEKSDTTDIATGIEKSPGHD